MEPSALFDAGADGKLVWFTNSATIEAGKPGGEIVTFSKTILNEPHKDKML